MLQADREAVSVVIGEDEVVIGEDEVVDEVVAEELLEVEAVERDDGVRRIKASSSLPPDLRFSLPKAYLRL